MVKTLTIKHDESLYKANVFYNEFKAIKENVIENATKYDSLNEEILNISDDYNAVESLDFQLDQQEQTMDDLYATIYEQNVEISTLKNNV